MRFGDVFLNQDGFTRHEQALNEVSHLKGGVTEEHPITLRALGDFYHYRKTTHRFNGLFNVDNVTNIDRYGNGDTVSGENLRGIQFVATLQNTLASVCRPYAKLFDMAKHGNAVLRDRMTDPRDDRIVREMATFVQHIHAAFADHE